MTAADAVIINFYGPSTTSVAAPDGTWITLSQHTGYPARRSRFHRRRPRGAQPLRDPAADPRMVNSSQSAGERPTMAMHAGQLLRDIAGVGPT